MLFPTASRYQIVDEVCGLVTHESRKAEAFAAAQRDQAIHDQEGDGATVIVFDNQATGGKWNEWKADGTELKRRASW